MDHQTKRSADMSQLFIVKPLILVMLGIAVTGCMYNTDSTGVQGGTPMQTTAIGEPATPAEEVKTASGGALGGYIEQFMDANDKSKMARALDGGLGKSIAWKNPVSGASFAVTPLRKVSMGEGICRAYSVTMTKTGVTDRVGGTACIGDDGVWHVS
jgi:surface antigen